MKKNRSKREIIIKDIGHEPYSKRKTRMGGRQEKLLEAQLSYFTPSKSSLHIKKEATRVEKSIEENLLAILDTSSVKNAEDIEDDKINFIEALHGVSIAHIVPNAPTRKLLKAVIEGLHRSQNMELTMASYQLLSDISKVFPHVCTTDTASEEGPQLLINHKVWTPFTPNIDDHDANGDDAHPSRFSKLIPTTLLDLPSLLHPIAAYLEEEKTDPSLDHSITILGRSLILRHFISLLWKDFTCRMTVFEACGDNMLLENSLISIHLKGQDKKTYMDFVRSLLRIIGATKRLEGPKSTVEHNVVKSDTYQESSEMSASTLKEFTLDNHLLYSATTFISMVISLAGLRNTEQNIEGMEDCDQRLESIDTILDILDYNKSMLEPLLEVIDSPKLKLFFIIYYFFKMAPKSIEKNMQTNLATSSIRQMLKCFVDVKDARNICKCINIDVIQTLLSHAFQATLLLHEKVTGASALQEVCELLNLALQNLKMIKNRDVHLDTFAKSSLILVEALSSSVPCIN